MKAYLVRHGQTHYNVAGLCNADPKVVIPLTVTGVSQAHKLAEDLRGAKFQQIFVSELLRTQQTAELINTYHHVPVTVDVRLNDNRSGFEGQSAQDYVAALEASANRWGARFNDGESIADVKDRVSNFIDDLAESKYESVLIVTSRTIIQLFNGIIDDLDYEDSWKIKVEIASFRELQL